MDEVTAAVIAIAVGLSAVFVPTAFIAGISGQFYRQFALTIAVSTLISAFVSLTLSPGLAPCCSSPMERAKIGSAAPGMFSLAGSSRSSITAFRSS